MPKSQNRNHCDFNLRSDCETLKSQNTNDITTKSPLNLLNTRAVIAAEIEMIQIAAISDHSLVRCDIAGDLDI